MIKITQQDLFEAVTSTLDIIMEGYYDVRGELICRMPYYVGMIFTNHCIERQYQRYITERDLLKDAETVIKDIIEDFESGKIDKKDYIKIINKESCVVTVCALRTHREKYSKTGIGIAELIAVTAYIWDGRMDIDHGKNYYIGEESKAYLEAQKWNAENRDKVVSYTEWKHNTDIVRQKKKADREYYYRNNTEMDPETKMRLINKTYDTNGEYRKREIHRAMGKEELDAVKNYFNKMERKPLASKGSANRDLRALDLWRKRKQQQKNDTDLEN